MSNKKGNLVIDSIVLIVVVLVFTIISIIGHKVFTELNTDVQADLDSATAKNTLTTLQSNYLPLMDNSILFIYVALLTFTLIAVFMLDTHPIFFIITVILMMAFFVVATLLANTYDDFASDAEISTYANNFTYAHWVFNNLLELAIATSFILMIALFIKFKT